MTRLASDSGLGRQAGGAGGGGIAPVVLITGSSTGVGAACVARLAAVAGRCSLVCDDRTRSSSGVSISR
jgi:hypothetical protein